MDEKRRIIAWMDDLLAQIFEDHTVSSQYQKLTDGKNQCLNFPKANEDWWEGCAKAIHSTIQGIAMIDSYEQDEDLQVGVKSIKYDLNMKTIRCNFVMFMKPCQENFKEARKTFPFGWCCGSTPF